MKNTISRGRVTMLGTGLAALLLAAGCGSVEVTADGEEKADPKPSATPSQEVDTSAGEGTWLLGMTSAGGADGEESTTVYLSYNPSTGQATAKELPGVTAASAAPEQAGLLLSADRAWAILDTEIPRAQRSSGKLEVHSVTGSGKEVIDIRQRTGEDDLKAIGWAFDPERAGTLRVVDTKNRIWAVKVDGGPATQEGTLPKGPWVFLNGFDRNTGIPYMESIENDTTNPPGKGVSDTSPVTRDGGTVLPAGSPELAKLPPAPCRLGAGFTDAEGLTWVFCADSDTVTTHYLPQGGKEWTAFGKPSSPVAPIAAGFPLVLPPQAP